MSMSLRDQLLKAGLVNEKQAKQATKQKQKQQRLEHKNQVDKDDSQRQAAEQAKAEKLARDQELNRQQQEKAEKKAKAAQIKQLIEGTRLPKLESDDYYNFVDAKKVKRIAVNDLIRDKLSRGSLAIVSYDGRYEIVPPGCGGEDPGARSAAGGAAQHTEPGAGRRRSLQGLCGARRSHVVRSASGVSLDRYGCRSTTNSGMRSSSKITTDDFVSIA